MHGLATSAIPGARFVDPVVLAVIETDHRNRITACSEPAGDDDLLQFRATHNLSVVITSQQRKRVGRDEANMWATVTHVPRISGATRAHRDAAT